MAKITRRQAIAAAGGLAGVGLLAPNARAQAATVERWGLYEIALPGPTDGNPFADVDFRVEFSNGQTVAEVTGFYDGGGVFRARFSPPELGEWRWITRSGASALAEVEGRFMVTAPSGANHGPVGVSGGYHFAHADGTPFRQIGTTSYGWTHQPEAMRRLTLETLRRGPFNKIRMAVFPNASLKTNVGPLPFERTGDGDRDWDASRFDPAFFQRLDLCVAALGELGIQADLILFHPYDGKHGFDEISPTVSEFYVNYVVARLSAFRNVWWSLANEFDILKTKDEADWDHLFQVVRDGDPHGRLRSIHNWRTLYDNGKPWVTHASIQNGSAVMDDVRAETYRSVWKKPVIFDEVRYEGSIDQRWGDLTGQEMVSAFWHGLIGGTYVGHSECLPVQPGGGFWLGEGGELRGESAPRLAFLKTVMEAGPTPGIEPIDKWWEQHLGGVAGRYYLRYFGENAPAEWPLDLPRDELTGGERFRADVIDTWNMTIEPVPGVFTMAQKTRYFFHDPARPTVRLPGRPWMAVRVTRID
ncbi:MAG: DUF5060 domain-containing protein [Brevundimonas sp.]|nr:MAG: DUF5060 domain-containing protein [Brevundimonas sp.]